MVSHITKVEIQIANKHIKIGQPHLQSGKCKVKRSFHLCYLSDWQTLNTGDPNTVVKWIHPHAARWEYTLIQLFRGQVYHSYKV